MVVEDWNVRLGREIRTRREALRLSQAEVGERADLGEATVRRIERGEAAKLRRSTLAGLERALEWEDHVVDHIIDGTVTQAELDPAAGSGNAPSATVVAVAELLRLLATQQRRTATMPEAVAVLSRLLPELYEQQP